MFQSFFKNNKAIKAGFTLIEIVVVIAIIATLSSIIYSSFDTSRAKSRDQKRISDISAIQLALELHFNKYGTYPANLLPCPLATCPGTTFLDKTFMTELPQPPLKPPVEKPYNVHYIPVSKSSNSPTANLGSCFSYILWTKFETGNAYLDSRKGFDSTKLTLTTAYNGLYECGSMHVKPTALEVADPYFFDVMP